MFRLNIRVKTFIAITCTMTMLSAIIGVSLYNLKQSNLQKIDDTVNQKNLQVAHSLLRGKQQNLQNIAEMFGRSDRVWQFVATGRKMDFVKQRLVALNLSFAVIYDAHLQPLYAYSYPGSPLSAEHVIDRLQQNYSQLLSDKLLISDKSGIIMVDGCPLLVALHPINLYKNSSESGGFFLVAIVIDTPFWQQVNEQWGIHAHIKPVTQQQLVKSEMSQLARASIMLNDIAGNAVVVLENDSPSLIAKILHRGFIFFISLLLIVSLMVLFVTHFVLEKLVLQRLLNLSRRLQRIGTVGGDEQLTVVADDEIGSIAISVNSMLARLQSGQQRLQLINKVFATTTEAIVITDSDNNIVKVNQAFIDLSGYNRSEMMGENPRVLKSQRHNEAFYQQMWQQIVDLGHWEGEVWDTRKNGEEYPKWLIIDTLTNRAGEVEYYIGVSVDLSKIKQAEQRLHYLAYFDHLTGLPNRVSFCESLEQRLQQIDQNIEEMSLAVIILDVDSFKQVNEAHGPEQTDRLLQLLAQRLSHCVFEDVVLARLGGDEFALLIDSEQCDRQLQMLSDCMQAPFPLDLQQITLSASIGIALAPEHGRSVAELIKNADVAMYSIKDVNITCHKYFHPQMNAFLIERLELAEMLRDALAKQEFELYYQPKIDLRDGTIIGAEALLRWHSPNGMTPPDKFIPIAEDIGLIIPIGEWVLREACRQMSEWRCVNADLHVAVNVSPLQFELDYLPQLVAQMLQQTGLPAQALELEITEETTINNIDKTVEILQAMHDLGVELSMDDFGTGYSSLSYLTRLPVDILKIDRSFMQGIPASQNSTNVVLAILSLARSLNLKVTAEGAETQEHITFLRENNCDYVQGYFCSRPLTAAKFLDFIQQK